MAKSVPAHRYLELEEMSRFHPFNTAGNSRVDDTLTSGTWDYGLQYSSDPRHFTVREGFEDVEPRSQSQAEDVAARTMQK